MPIWVSLLRGINLGAHNKVNMPALRAALGGAGFEDVRTYVQSGNIVARSNHRKATGVAEAVRRVVLDVSGVDVPVVVRTGAELREVLDWCPFPDAVANEPKMVHIVHFSKAPDADAVEALLADDWFPDAVAWRERDLVIAYGKSMHESRLARSPAFRRAAGAGTSRNWRTLQALVDLVQSVEGA